MQPPPQLSPQDNCHSLVSRPEVEESLSLCNRWIDDKAKEIRLELLQILFSYPVDHLELPELEELKATVSATEWTSGLSSGLAWVILGIIVSSLYRHVVIPPGKDHRVLRATQVSAELVVFVNEDPQDRLSLLLTNRDLIMAIQDVFFTFKTMTLVTTSTEISHQYGMAILSSKGVPHLKCQYYCALMNQLLGRNQFTLYNPKLKSVTAITQKCTELRGAIIDFLNRLRTVSYPIGEEFLESVPANDRRLATTSQRIKKLREVLDDLIADENRKQVAADYAEKLRFARKQQKMDEKELEKKRRKEAKEAERLAKADSIRKKKEEERQLAMAQLAQAEVMQMAQVPTNPDIHSDDKKQARKRARTSLRHYFAGVTDEPAQKRVLSEKLLNGPSSITSIDLSVNNEPEIENLIPVRPVTPRLPPPRIFESSSGPLTTDAFDALSHLYTDLYSASSSNGSWTVDANDYYKIWHVTPPYGPRGIISASDGCSAKMAIRTELNHQVVSIIPEAYYQNESVFFDNHLDARAFFRADNERWDHRPCQRLLVTTRPPPYLDGSKAFGGIDECVFRESLYEDNMDSDDKWIDQFEGEDNTSDSDDPNDGEDLSGDWMDADDKEVGRHTLWSLFAPGVSAPEASQATLWAQVGSKLETIYVPPEICLYDIPKAVGWTLEVDDSSSLPVVEFAEVAGDDLTLDSVHSALRGPSSDVIHYILPNGSVSSAVFWRDTQPKLTLPNRVDPTSGKKMTDRNKGTSSGKVQVSCHAMSSAHEASTTSIRPSKLSLVNEASNEDTEPRIHSLIPVSPPIKSRPIRLGDVPLLIAFYANHHGYNTNTLAKAFAGQRRIKEKSVHDLIGILFDHHDSLSSHHHTPLTVKPDISVLMAFFSSGEKEARKIRRESKASIATENKELGKAP